MEEAEKRGAMPVSSAFLKGTFESNNEKVKEKNVEIY